MIHENVELHNVAELVSVDGGRLRLQRVPEALRPQLNERARQMVLRPANCELRFVSDADQVQLTLSSDGQTEARVFYGPFDSRDYHVIGPEPTTITIGTSDRLRRLPRRWWDDQPFDPNVRRICFGGRLDAPVYLHKIEGDGIRPPRPEEKPATTYLAYGTSITQGAKSEAPHLNYVSQAAWHLKADPINLGLGGSCFCEPAMADYIAARRDWNVATLSLSVNMQSFELDEFRRRVSYMVKTVAGADTSRSVTCVTLFPYARDFDMPGDPSLHGGMPEDYRQGLRDAVAAYDGPNVQLVEGPSLLGNIGGLTHDLVHPSEHAMIEMGRNLAEAMQAFHAG